MADCSKTKVFFEELDRMCETVNKYSEVEDCVFYKPHYGCCGHMDWLPDGVEKAITVLQKWSDEHPKKTRQSELLKMYPNFGRWRDERGELYIDFCPKSFDSTLKCRKDDSGRCLACMKEYWSEEVE